MEWYQLVIFAVVVIALLVLGFFFGRWLRGLVPTAQSIIDALNAAWERFVAWISRPFSALRGGTALAETPEGGDTAGIYSGSESGGNGDDECVGGLTRDGAACLDVYL